MSLTAQAPAKINLGLHVLRQRSDGEHEIETVFHRLDWADTITVRPAGTLSMTCSDPALPTDERNLCLQAAKRLADAFGVTSGATLHLEKRVPYGAGLGSGSSNAATTLQLLAQLWGLEASRESLHDLARQIGADVPFFLWEDPAAYATGRGDRLASLSSDGGTYRLPFPVVVVVPPIAVPTDWAYEQVTPNDGNRPNLRDLVRANDLDHWPTALTNDFEAPVIRARPVVASIRKRLDDEEAAYVSLSGSGGAVYGLFRTEEEAQRAQEAMQATDCRVHLMPVPEGGLEEGAQASGNTDSMKGASSSRE